MTYEYKSHIYLAKAVLNVKDLASQTAFYQQVIGLEILSQTETEVVLGLGGTPLAKLFIKSTFSVGLRYILPPLVVGEWKMIPTICIQ